MDEGAGLDRAECGGGESFPEPSVCPDRVGAVEVIGVGEGLHVEVPGVSAARDCR